MNCPSVRSDNLRLRQYIVVDLRYDTAKFLNSLEVFIRIKLKAFLLSELDEQQRFVIVFHSDNTVFATADEASFHIW